MKRNHFLAKWLSGLIVIGILVAMGTLLNPSSLYAQQCPSGYTYVQFNHLCCKVIGVKRWIDYADCTKPIGGREAGWEEEAPCPGDECETALGTIPAEPGAFVEKFLELAIGIGGGVAFLLMLWGGFTVITSTGNPEKINKGKETITSAVIGLLFIIFSVVLFQIIGYDILGLGPLGLEGQ